MKERPIIFSTKMVRAILDGRKTQTRRVIKPEWLRCLDLDDFDDLRKALAECPYGQPGDRLWVKEALSIEKKATQSELECGHFAYKADDDDENLWITELGFKTIPSIFMPRWASRITLEIVKVRVQRVMRITNEDAEAEGVGRIAWLGNDRLDDYRRPYRELWDKLNAKSGFGWDANPWVWVIEFRRLDLNPSPSPLGRGAQTRRQVRDDQIFQV